MPKEQLMLGWFCLMTIVWIVVMLRQPRAINAFLPVFWFILGFVGLFAELKLEPTFQIFAGRSIQLFGPHR